MSWPDLAASALDACMATFGRPVQYRSAAGGSSSIKGVFDAAHIVLMIQDGVEYSTIKPTLGVKLSDLESSSAQGDQLTVENASYQVTDVQVDGQGGALLILQKL